MEGRLPIIRSCLACKDLRAWLPVMDPATSTVTAPRDLTMACRDLLSGVDREILQSMTTRWTSANHHATKHDNFIVQLRTLHHFIGSRDDGTSLRALACGIFFGGHIIIVETRRLDDTMGRSKSTVNALMRELGFE